MNPIDELIIKIEAYPHKVITKEYVLKHLRESQRHECEFCEQTHDSKFRTWRKPLQNVKGGDSNRLVSENNRRSS